MFTGTTLDTPEKKLSKKQKAHRTKSIVELDRLIRELEKIQMTTPLMFVDKEASMNAVAQDTIPTLPSIDEYDELNMPASPANKKPPLTIPKDTDDSTDTDSSPILQRKYEIPEPKFEHHYLIPTVSSSLPIYLQGENERIRSSFRSHTCWTIKKLPNLLMTGEVQRNRRQHAVENLVSTSSNTFKPASLLKARDFGKPEYIGTDFDKMKNLNKIQVEQEKIRIDSYSRRPFVVSSRIRAKFEDIFNDDSYQFAYMGPGGNVVKLDAITRGGGIQDRGEANSAPGLSTSLPAKSGGKFEADLSVIKSWVMKLHEQVASDWPMYSFRIRFAPTQEILIQFAYPKSSGQGATQTADGTGIIPPFPPPNNALNKYMHHLASHGLASQFNLAKRGDRWHVVERDWPDSGSTVSPVGTSESNSPNADSSHAKDYDRMDRDANVSSLGSSGESDGDPSHSRSKLEPEPALSESRTHETVVLTKGGLLEEDKDGNRWFRPLPHYHHHDDDTSPSQPVRDESTEQQNETFSPQPVDVAQEGQSPTLRLKKSVSFSGANLATLAQNGDDDHQHLEDTVENLSDPATAQHHQQKPVLRRRLSSSMPALETMVEETSSQLSSKRSSIAVDKHGNRQLPRHHGKQDSSNSESGELENSNHTDYLTFSFYTPWVSCRQANTAKFYAQQDRFHAREKLRQRKEKQTKLLAELDAAIAEEKARATRQHKSHQHHHHHHHHHHSRNAGDQNHGGHAMHGSISAVPSTSFSLTDTVLSGLNNAHGYPHAHGNLNNNNNPSDVPSSNSSAASFNHSHAGASSSSSHPSHSFSAPSLSRQTSMSSNISALANLVMHQQQQPSRAASSFSKR